MQISLMIHQRDFRSLESAMISAKYWSHPRTPLEPPKKTSPPVKYTDGGWWYRRSKPRVHPTVVVAEFIEKRDVEKDCNEDVNVYRLTKTITIRNVSSFLL
ncbi:hypothetical protein COOONC_23638 [Cooperia oncophora]